MNPVSANMTSPAVFASALTSVGRVLELIESHAISAVPLVDEGRLVGIVSTTDLVRFESSGGDLSTRPAREVMTSPVLTTSPDAPLDEAGRRMVAGRVHRLIVTKEDRVVGVISARDLLNEAKAQRIMTPISKLMTTRPIWIDIGDTIDFAIERIAEAQVHGLVVMEGSRAVGVFTHAEALWCRTLPSALRRNPVEEVMSYETIFLDASTPLYRAAGHAIALNVRRILVAEHRQLVGILSCIDLVDAISRSS
jgi:CBS domain-containing protein